MKKGILILFSIMLTLPLYSQTIKIAYFQSAPYVFKDKDSGKIQGATYDYLEEKIGPEMGVKFEWSPNPIPIARQLKQLQSGEMDASAMFAKNPEREKIFVYPDKPYFISHPILAVKKQHELQKVQTINDVLKLKIGFCAKSYTSPFMRDERINWDLIFSSSCIEQNLKKLIVNRFDAQYQPSEVGLLYYARTSGVENKIRLVPLPEEVNVYVPFSKQAAAKYMDKFNSAMDKVGSMDVFMQYLAKYIDITKLEPFMRK